tara:strand:+ start:1402 stop:2433 length:1032 start_codon:yes stop_codon:yes gene_type:complete
MVSIPNIVHQTHKSIEFVRSKPKLLKGARSWISTGCDYRFYSDECANNFMKGLEKDFPGIYTIYSKLPIPVMKADLFRYCVVYKNGGIYADMDTTIKKGKIKKLLSFNGFVCSNDPHFINNNTDRPEYLNTRWVCQWVFSCPPNSPVLNTIIRVILKKLSSVDIIKEASLNSKWFIHDLTGPTIFTEGIKEYLLQNGETKKSIKRAFVCTESKEVFEKKASKIFLRNNILLHPDSFHEDVVTHICTGFDQGGWREQMENYVVNIFYNPDKKIRLIKIIKDQRYPDNFNVQIDCNKITVRRIDSNHGWGQNLMLVVKIKNKHYPEKQVKVLVGSSDKNTKVFCI